MAQWDEVTRSFGRQDSRQPGNLEDITFSQRPVLNQVQCRRIHPDHSLARADRSVVAFPEISTIRLAPASLKCVRFPIRWPSAVVQSVLNVFYKFFSR